MGAAYYFGMNIAAASAIETLDDDFYADPHAHYHRWRERGPVLRVHAPEGVVSWLIVGYAEARAALRDPRLCKSANGIAALFRRTYPGAPANAPLTRLGHNMVNSDPPDHTRLRTLVNKAFTPRAVAALRPKIAESVAALLDRMAEQHEVDLLTAFVLPLPVGMICDLLGVPRADQTEFRRWAREMFRIVGAERDAAMETMREYLRELVRAKRAHPGADLLSGLVHARDADDRLTEQELMDTAVLLLISGHGTTVDLLTTGALALLRDESLMRKLRANPAAMPAAVDEFLRFDGPVHLTTVRYTAEPVRIGDIDIPAGEFVHIAVAAANHDPAHFPDPDRLDITRPTDQHLGFGHGAHFCVGAALARMEAEVAFTALLHRFPHLHLALPESDLMWHNNFGFPTLTALPVRPGPSGRCDAPASASTAARPRAVPAPCPPASSA
ncbi:cytochrome P450 family protein [Nocardia terpenica]|uniref:cytochrome P450 family protein n=1 Tax=Nocardia terpenica TaxID=455432 RepID=UPI001E5BA958|nr:cytochrome P450 [Nocardia terpenica]